MNENRLPCHVDLRNIIKYILRGDDLDATEVVKHYGGDRTLP